MGTFIGRCTGKTDYADGDGIDLQQLRAMLSLYDAGVVGAAYIKNEWTLTTGQGAELDEILATRPLAEISTNWLKWEGKIVAVMQAGYAKGAAGWTNYETNSDCRVALGLSP